MGPMGDGWVGRGLGRLRGTAVIRDATEVHRASTPLELLFDLAFVVAISRAAATLHHELSAGHGGLPALFGFGAVFFTVWWAWMNFTWFASAHDADDVSYRILTFIQIVGVLILAAGVPSTFEVKAFAIATLGYLVMRIGLVASWLRVARDQPSSRRRALRFAGGITVLQVLWVLRLLLPDGWAIVTFFVLAAAEMVVPIWAERTVPEPMFHPQHIEERYGLFTVIVLGESILAVTADFSAALEEQGVSPSLLAVGLGGLGLAFAAWWLYFDGPDYRAPIKRLTFRWGYAHAVVFAALAAMGAGIQVAADAVTGHAAEGTRALAVAVPVALFLLGLVLLVVVTGRSARDNSVGPLGAGVVLVLVLGALAPMAVAVVGCALVLVALVLHAIATAPEAAEAGDGVSPDPASA
jgi:low temperature requirement protein LtrA